MGLIPAAQLVLGVTDVAADLREDGVHSDGTGRVKLGMAEPGDAPDRARAVARCLEGAGFEVTAQDDVRPAIWEKVAFNAAFNAVATLADAQVRDLDNPTGRRLVFSVLDEATALARAEGVAFDAQGVTERIEAAYRHQGGHRPSMAQDRRAGRRTEIAAINGALARLGERRGVPVAVNRTLADLVELTGG